MKTKLLMDGWHINTKMFLSLFMFMILYCSIATILSAEKSLNLQKITTIHGVAPGDGFGSPVQNLGDINNDGYPDLAVGYQYYPYSSVTYKRIDIYYGGATLDTIPDLTFWRPLNIHGNMDLNGDGYIDLAAYYNTSFDIGMVKIFFGSIDGPDTTADITLYGEWYYGKFGSQMASGDLNKDGYDDLIISSPHDDYAAYGRVYVYLGGNPMDTEPDWFYQSPDEFAYYGESLVCGDLNANGYADFLVGAPYNLARKPGKIYIYSGGDTLATTAARIVQAPDSLSYLGRKMVYVSDWNDSEYGMVLAGWIINQDGYHNGVLKIMATSDIKKPETAMLNNRNEPDDQYFFEGFVDGNINYDEIKDILIRGNTGQNAKMYMYFGPNDMLNPDTSFNFNDLIMLSYSEPLNTIDINNDGMDELIVYRIIPSSENWRLNLYSIDIYSSQPFPLNGIHEDNQQKWANDFILESNYPNPFNNSTNIHFYLSISEKVNFTVYDLLGHEVDKINANFYNEGYNNITWSATGLPSGIYIIKMSSDNRKISQFQKIIILR